ncbi:metalloregulator ArsR/SmtB family transcription factor [Mycobacterium sp.]|uniref:ArsR/SmtB family transcription factor n=1 Tax=Mycobacterium sp. TaxID=1785 RepID=UPI002D0916E6|nr:metalloregulator ArsR/SmtB family transcription factor [Mycobacterium sp.]HKP41072.1 metalloregulator ArsR/SmtB family transcription factor [Mycobacterium sp.]
MDEVFKALADPSRRLLLDSLNARNGQSLRELCARLSMARQSVSKHLAVLEAANLVTTVWRGREKLHYVNAEPINAIADRWINQYHRARVQTLADLKTALETESMSSSAEFVYTTYIRTTPERLWQAITDPAFSRRYMGHAMVSDWSKGSTYAWVQDELEIEHPDQVILESDPYRRLAFAFHTFVPELAAAGLSEETIAKAAAEKRSKVSFDIESVGDGQVKLTVIHGDFGPDSTVRGLISGGWPKKLSDLKSGLEAGRSDKLN